MSPMAAATRPEPLPTVLDRSVTSAGSCQPSTLSELLSAQYDTRIDPALSMSTTGVVRTLLDVVSMVTAKSPTPDAFL